MDVEGKAGSKTTTTMASSCDHRAGRSQGREDGKLQWKVQISAIEAPLRKAPQRSGQTSSVRQRIGHVQERLESADTAPVAVADVNQIRLHIVEASPIFERAGFLDVSALDCDPEHLGSWEGGHIVQKQRHVGIDLLQLDHKIERILQGINWLVRITDHEEQVLINTVPCQTADRLQRRFNRGLVRDARKKLVRAGLGPDRNLHQSRPFQSSKQLIIHLCHSPADRCRDPANARWQFTPYERFAKFEKTPPAEKEIAIIEQDPVGPMAQPELDVGEHPPDRDPRPLIFRIETKIASKRTAAAENGARLPVAIDGLEYVSSGFDQIIRRRRIVIDVFQGAIRRGSDFPVLPIVDAEN